MPERIGAHLFLLARFAEFFEAVAGIKLAISEGRLGAVLTVGDEPPPTESGDLAARVSARLESVLLAQAKDVARKGTPREIEAYRSAMYVMAALTDEIFILEIPWVGHEAWMDVLLERKLFHTGNAGVSFFDTARTLLDAAVHDPLDIDLAAVMVMALQLGFKGRYRGANSDGELRGLRDRLFRLVEREHGPREVGPAFPQTLQQLQAGGTPARLAPLTPWYTGSLVVLAIYLVISSIGWLLLLEPFRRAIGKG